MENFVTIAPTMNSTISSSNNVIGPRTKRNRNKKTAFDGTSIYKKFVNTLMKRGEKSVSEKILGTCCMLIKMRNRASTSFVIKAIQNVKPLVELKSQQKGFRKKSMKPIAINSNRGYKLAID